MHNVLEGLIYVFAVIGVHTLIMAARRAYDRLACVLRAVRENRAAFDQWRAERQVRIGGEPDRWVESMRTIAVPTVRRK